MVPPPPTAPHRVLLVGLPNGLAAWMERRFAAAVRVTEVDYGAVDEIQGVGWSLLVLDEPLGTEEAEARLRQIRSAHGVAELPVIACLDSAVDRERARVLIAELGVEQILFYPLNREELAQQIARILNIPLPPAPVERTPQQHIRAAMAEMWTRLQDSVFRRLELLEEAVASALEDHLGADQRREAEREAHKLAGSIGTFGFMEASRRAREMEHIFEGAARLAPSEAARLADLVVEIRNELERAPTNPEPEEDQAVPEAGPGSVLLVSGDTGLAEQITRAATARGIQVETVPDLTGVEALLARESFRVVLLDLDTPPDSTQAFDLIGGLATRSPAIPVLVLASSGAFTDRIQAMRRGAAVFLQKPLQSDGILDAVTRHMGDPQTKGLRLLALDDDPHMLAVLRGMLAPTGIQLTTESDPLRFWEVLEETTPDLLILDLDLPHVSGIEICRVVRSDQRWSGLPILFLTARTDTDAVRRIFAAGADDYVAKPVAGPELLSRIRNRWERIQLYRRLAETDFLTGVVTRGKSVEMMERLLSLARRNAQPFSVAVLDLDGFKQINDRFGHAAGDVVLRRLGQLLLQSFREEDVVARWGGEEFVVGMFGMSREDGVNRFANILEVLRQEEFRTAEDRHFQATFSAGIAVFPEDGADLQTLHRAADKSLYQAKAMGRNRVLSSGWEAESLAEATSVDVVVVEDDETLGDLLIHSLEARGYTTRWIQDGQAASYALGGENPTVRARVVLLDVDLPGLNGLAVLKQLIRDGVGHRTRFIMLTLRSEEREVVQALEMGAFDHVAKPFSVPVLMQRIRRALEA